ncbi:MAG: hypothetical protein OXE95_12585 [Chloroflexi bacterium]|nr:hypothetical protein [Chloroflexota bacterium]MCY4248398.1 hypothetical protein [Chloroflexota bacterium]
MPARQRSGRLLAFAFATIAALALYFHVARIQSEVNKDHNKSDQSAYIDAAIAAYETSFHDTGDRVRMPLFPWVMALFYSPDMTEETFFATGKVVNTYLSGLILCLISAMFVQRFTLGYAAYASLSIAFLTFAIKAPWFQTEILLYGIFAAAFIRAVDVLRRPVGWRSGLEVGALVALVHFTKAMGLLFLISYLGALFVQWLAGFALPRKRADSVREQVGWRLLSHAAAFLLAFVVVLSPYLLESYQRFGMPFYNASNTFYVWYDSWQDAKRGTKAAGDREHYPDLPEEQIPSLSKYLREHTATDILDRFVTGAQRMSARSCTDTKYKYEYGFCSQVGLGLLALAIVAPWIALRTPKRELAAAAGVICFVILVHLSNALGTVWYNYIGTSGPRGLLALLVPLFWTLGLTLHSRIGYALRFRFFSIQARVYSAVLTVLGITLVYEIYQTVTHRAFAMWGGK